MSCNPRTAAGKHPVLTGIRVCAHCGTLALEASVGTVTHLQRRGILSAVIRSHERGRAPLRPWVLACTLLAGCAEAVEPQSEDDLESYRLGRVHVVLDALDAPAEGDVGPSEHLAVTARFAFVRGLSEGFARARIDMPVLPTDVLEPQHCALQSRLQPSHEDQDERSSQHAPTRELVLADAGPLELELGDLRTALPLALVPDLLPYMSGVEYVYVAEGRPASAAQDLALRSAGSEFEGLPEFEVESPLPPGVRLTLAAETDADVLALLWDSASTKRPLILRIWAQHDGRPSLDPLVCLLDDVGQARISLDYLLAEGLEPTAEALRIEASRSHLSHFTAGDFSGTELLVERRSHLEIALR